jgi:hypothetical protein
MNIASPSSELPLRRSDDRLDQSSLDTNQRVDTGLALAKFRRQRPPFEIRNVSGRTARGIEIEVAGFRSDDVFRAYYLNRTGVPQVAKYAQTIRISFESLCRAPVNALSHAIVPRGKASVHASLPYVWEFALFGSGNSDRFCFELSTLDVVVTYRWLNATDESIETLVADEAPAYVQEASACG